MSSMIVKIKYLLLIISVITYLYRQPEYFNYVQCVYNTAVLLNSDY